MAKKSEKRTMEEIRGEINAMKILLNQTDYKALKHADGVISDEEYAETAAQRNSWRQRVNELEAELEGIEE